MVGRDLKSVTGSMADVNKANVKKKLQDDLDVINNSLQGRISIADAKVLGDIPTTNSKDNLFKCIKKLYDLSVGAIGHIKVSSERREDAVIMEDTMKRLLEDLLPGVLEAALKKHTVEEKTVKRSKTIKRNRKM